MDGTLAGGNMNAVERVGDTVRRNAGPWTPTVHRYLDYLARAGVDWAPKPLGIDGDREVLSFVDGEVPLYPLPDWVWADSVLVDGARRLRQLHDGSDATWSDVIRVAIIRLHDLGEISLAKAAELRKPQLRVDAAGYRRDAEYLNSIFDH
jgi:hypothetical protein